MRKINLTIDEFCNMSKDEYIDYKNANEFSKERGNLSIESFDNLEWYKTKCKAINENYYNDILLKINNPLLKTLYNKTSNSELTLENIKSIFPGISMKLMQQKIKNEKKGYSKIIRKPIQVFIKSHKYLLNGTFSIDDSIKDIRQIEIILNQGEKIDVPPNDAIIIPRPLSMKVISREPHIAKQKEKELLNIGKVLDFKSKK